MWSQFDAKEGVTMPTLWQYNIDSWLCFTCRCSQSTDINKLLLLLLLLLLHPFAINKCPQQHYTFQPLKPSAKPKQDHTNASQLTFSEWTLRARTSAAAEYCWLNPKLKHAVK
jgi:hypothetical protein